MPRFPNRETKSLLRRCSLLSAIGALLLAPRGSLEAQSSSEPEADVAVLFRDHDPLRLRIEADFHALKRDRDEDNEERDGHLFVVGGDDPATAHPVEIRTRGRFRLQSKVCRFPPLRLDFPKSRMDGTVFEGQDKLKLVTHCRDDDDYEQNTIEEYLVYRIYNLLTDRSFQARLARITYVDTSGEDDPVERWGFVIESEEALAERLEATVIEENPAGVHPARFQPAEVGRVDLFSFMVANTDYSIYSMHNVVPFARAGGAVIPIPYDFDWTGLVDARYAEPDARLRLRNVRQRIYRGICRDDLDYAALYDAFQARKGAITALVVEQPQLGDDEREDVLKFLDGFWEILDDPDKAHRSIEGACRQV